MYCGVLREIPSLKNMSASEYVRKLNAYWRRHETGWYLYIVGKGNRAPTVWYYPYPGRVYPRVFLEEIAEQYPEEMNPEFQAMINFSIYHESMCFIFLVLFLVFNLRVL